MSLAVSSLGVAVVTGAARGIGRAVALRLAKDGYDVGLNDLPTAAESLEGVAKEITALGRRPYIALGDVSVSANVQNILSTTVENLGELNVMVANAGISRDIPIIETELSEWDKVLSVNALSTFLCYKYAALQMIKQGKGGSIIGASSVAGRQAYANAALYSASKFAIRGLTQAAAQELGRHGITVNSYCPGLIETDILTELFAERTPALLESFRNSCALGRNGTPEDIAGVVSYLASKDARFITGQSITVDGGRHFS